MEQDTISRVEFLKELKKPGPVFAWVKLYDSDGEYLPVSKGLLLQLAKGAHELTRFEARRRDGGLYIN